MISRGDNPISLLREAQPNDNNQIMLRMGSGGGSQQQAANDSLMEMIQSAIGQGSNGRDGSVVANFMRNFNNNSSGGKKANFNKIIQALQAQSQN